MYVVDVGERLGRYCCIDVGRRRLRLAAVSSVDVMFSIRCGVLGINYRGKAVQCLGSDLCC